MKLIGGRPPSRDFGPSKFHQGKKLHLDGDYVVGHLYDGTTMPILKIITIDDTVISMLPMATMRHEKYGQVLRVDMDEDMPFWVELLYD
jgi:hypothetical protein